MKLSDIINSYNLITEMPRSDIKEATMILKHIFMKHMGLIFEFSDHAKDHLLSDFDTQYTEKGRESDITKEDIYYILKELIKRYKDNILNYQNNKKEFLGVIINKSNNINIVFKIDFQNKKKHNIIRIITIMRKKGFVSKEIDRVFYI
jgi:hypothetical protein